MSRSRFLFLAAGLVCMVLEVGLVFWAAYALALLVGWWLFGLVSLVTWCCILPVARASRRIMDRAGDLEFLRNLLEIQQAAQVLAKVNPDPTPQAWQQALSRLLTLYDAVERQQTAGRQRGPLGTWAVAQACRELDAVCVVFDLKMQAAGLDSPLDFHDRTQDSDQQETF